MQLKVLETKLAVTRFPPESGLPWWAATSSFLSFTRTSDETSLVCDEACVPGGLIAEKGFRALRVEGPLPFHLTGVLASLATPLAAAGVSIFVVSTHDTDYVLVPEPQLSTAIEALRIAKHAVEELKS
jgi:hypothetical protein